MGICASSCIGNKRGSFYETSVPAPTVAPITPTATPVTPTGVPDSIPTIAHLPPTAIPTLSPSEDLASLEYKTTPVWKPPSLDGHRRCKVLKVYDGDTVTLGFYLDGQPVKASCRCYGYNCAEIRSKKKDPAEKAKEQELARAARDYLTPRINGKIVETDFRGVDPVWNRPMVDIFDPISGKVLSKLMIDTGHAIEYYGVGDKGY